uniref:Putative secreted peptide n=1 Tax=Anopheles braziliensis TaxID=58242 RepID=A0A2M3ZRP7_9DIPT
MPPPPPSPIAPPRALLSVVAVANRGRTATTNGSTRCCCHRRSRPLPLSHTRYLHHQWWTPAQFTERPASQPWMLPPLTLPQRTRPKGWPHRRPMSVAVRTFRPRKGYTSDRNRWRICPPMASASSRSSIPIRCW